MSRFKPSYQLDHDLRTNPEFVAALVTVADGIVTRARAIAPVGPSSQDEEPGAYRDSIHTEVREGRTGRKRVAVVASDFKSIWIEFGTIHNPAYAVLRKAARQSFSKGKHGLGAGKRVGRVANSKYSRNLSRVVRPRAAGLPAVRKK